MQVQRTVFKVPKPWSFLLTALAPYLLFGIQESTAIECYECAYRENGGNPQANAECLHPDSYPTANTRLTCPWDKPTCIKARATTAQFGTVMERGCFPQLSSNCRQLASLSNQDPSDLFFGAALTAVQSQSIREIVFDQVRVCFCNKEHCNGDPGTEVTVAKRARPRGRQAGPPTNDDTTPAPPDNIDNNSTEPAGDDGNSTDSSVGPGGGDGSGRRICYGCLLGIECARYRMMSKLECPQMEPCYTATVFLGHNAFKERGCGSCDYPPEVDHPTKMEVCKDCDEDLCNGTTTTSVSLLSMIPLSTLISFFFLFFWGEK